MLGLLTTILGGGWVGGWWVVGLGFWKIKANSAQLELELELGNSVHSWRNKNIHSSLRNPDKKIDSSQKQTAIKMSIHPGKPSKHFPFILWLSHWLACQVIPPGTCSGAFLLTFSEVTFYSGGLFWCLGRLINVLWVICWSGGLYWCLGGLYTVQEGYDVFPSLLG